MTNKRKTFLSLLLISPLFITATSFAEIPFNVINSPTHKKEHVVDIENGKYTISAIIGTTEYELKCKNITETQIVIPKVYKNDIFEYTITKISDNGCANLGLEEVTLPSSIKTIGDNAFKDNQLDDINIPLHVTKIGSKAFANNVITNVHSNPEKAPIIELDTFEGNNINFTYIKENSQGYDSSLGWVNVKVKGAKE